MNRSRMLWSSLPLLVVALAAGCAGTQNGAVVKLDPALPGPVLRQHFRAAYATERADGQYDVVLVDESAPRSRQAMEIRLHWRPMRGAKSDQPSATNASIDWYVISSSAAGHADLLHYAGAGFVDVERARGGLWVSVRNASMKLAATKGDVTDPLGPTDLRGDFYAYLDQARAVALMDEIRDATTDLRTAEAVRRSTAPARAPARP